MSVLLAFPLRGQYADWTAIVSQAERRELTASSDSFLFLLRCHVDAADNLPKKHVGGDVVANGAQG